MDLETWMLLDDIELELMEIASALRSRNGVRYSKPSKEKQRRDFISHCVLWGMLVATFITIIISIAYAMETA